MWRGRVLLPGPGLLLVFETPANTISAWDLDIELQADPGLKEW